jgi:transposase InsO family protein
VRELAGAGWAVRAACALAGISHATWYRSLSPDEAAGVQIPHTERAYPNRIGAVEQEAFLAELNSPEHADLSVTQAWHRMLDAGKVFCSLSSALRIAARAGQNGDRRAQRPRGAGTSRAKPVHEADAPNLLWSWDITMLRGPGRHTYRLYTVIDVHSRRVMGHRVETAETAHLAAALIRQTVAAAGAAPEVLHADNGAPMRATSTLELARTLGIGLSFSRPRVSNDNPYSEAMFRTVKYDPGFPDRFDSLEHARAWTAAFFADYNANHRHSGLNYHTPDETHHGTTEARRLQRQHTLDAYYQANPHRFRNRPTAKAAPAVAGINTQQPKLSQTA